MNKRNIQDISFKSYSLFTPNRNDRVIMLIIYIVFASLSVFYGAHLSVPLVIDEVGTVANTAFMAGDDWSIAVQSMGGFYYKYGQSALYLPMYLLLKKHPFLMYKAFISFHMLCISFIPVIAYYICRKYLQVNSKTNSVLLAISGGGISSLWLYSLYSRADMMLILLPWVLILIMLELSTTEKGKKRNLLTICLSFISVYAYMCHSRGIVLLIATVLTLIVMDFIYKKRFTNYYIYIPLSVALLIVDKFVSAYIKRGVYGDYGTKHASIENFDFDTFKQIFTLKGFVIELKLCIGWLFNLSASSMGLVLLGVIAAIIILIKGIRLKNMTDKENLFALFSLLCIIGTFALGALFFFPHAYELMTGIKVDRADRMIYGRYTVGAVAPICLLALYTLTCKRGLILKTKSKLAALFIYIVTLALFALKVGPALNNIPETNSRYFLSLTGFLNIVNSLTNAAFPDLTSALVKAGTVSLLVMILIIIITYSKKDKVIFLSCALVFVLSVVNFNYIFANVRNARDDLIVKRVKNIINYVTEIEGIEEVSNKYPILYKDDTATIVKFYQLGLPEFNVGKLKYIKQSKQQDFLILCEKNEIDTAIANCTKIYGQDNYYLFESFDYNKSPRDVIFVKGDNLANLLTKNGNKLMKYNN